MADPQFRLAVSTVDAQRRARRKLTRSTLGNRWTLTVVALAAITALTIATDAGNGYSSGLVLGYF
ncbi:hypothetical protein [Tomitella biformata]|uniref:hypothetical protein n=1 Tax=Tomitella biformata TaxID=630403 RepID=UPI0004BA7364|nr:hypothetical protein [Tomitella biformata]